MSEKCRNNSDNPLTSHRTDGRKKDSFEIHIVFDLCLYRLSERNHFEDWEYENDI